MPKAERWKALDVVGRMVAHMRALLEKPHDKNKDAHVRAKMMWDHFFASNLVSHGSASFANIAGLVHRGQSMAKLHETPRTSSGVRMSISRRFFSKAPRPQDPTDKPTKSIVVFRELLTQAVREFRCQLLTDL